MVGEGSDGGTDGGEESGGAGLSFRPQAVVFICKWSFVFMGDCSHWQVFVFIHGQGVVSWVLVIHTSGPLSSMLSFVVTVAVLGVCCLWAPCCHLWVVGAHSQAVYIIHGWGADVHGWWSSYRHGGGRESSMCGWLLFHHGVVMVHCHVTWPLASGCEKGMENGTRHLLEHT